MLSPAANRASFHRLLLYVVEKGSSTSDECLIHPVMGERAGGLYHGVLISFWAG
jgi:hypothetical protein